MADIMDKFRAAPPVTRTLVLSMAAVSALRYGGLIGYHHINFDLPEIFKFPPEMWRFFSAFLLTGPSFSFFLDLYFTWTYASGLELHSPRFSQPGDFFTYVAFLALVISSTSGLLLGGDIFTSALILAFVYTFAQDNRGKKAHFIVVSIPIEYLPWAMLTLALIMGGWQLALLEATGVVAAHLYDFLTRLYPTFQGGKNYIQTPNAIKRYFGADRPTINRRAYGTAFRPGQTVPPQASSGWSSALGGGWGGRGQGRRLGGG